jgi:hypothetical protein
MISSASFLTLPLDAISLRRADPIGFRAIADAYADALAPGLNGRCSDAHWLFCLAWSLRAIHAARPDLMDLDEAKRYAWLRPLELLWVRQGLIAYGDQKSRGAQLPGRRILVRVREHEGEVSRRFGMPAQAWRRYRQTGPYGGYRILLRRLAECTGSSQAAIGDGWTIGRLAETMAQELTERLRLHQPEPSAPSSDPERFWREYWPAPDRWRPEQEAWWLPVASDTRLRKMPTSVATKALQRALFEGTTESETAADARTRGDTITRLAERRVASFGSALTLLERADRQRLGGIAVFSTWSDSLLAVLEGVSEFIDEQDDDDSAPVDLVVRQVASAAESCWVSAESLLRMDQPGSCVADTWHTAKELAKAIRRLRRPKDIVVRILEHHAEHRHGAKWLSLADGRVARASWNTGSQTSRYGFRLPQLTRLAAQMGRIDPDAADRVGNGEMKEADDV